MKTTEEQLNDLIKDAKPVLDNWGDFRFIKGDDSDDLLFQEASKTHSQYLDTGFFISEDEGAFMVCQAVVVRGVYRTKNGDGRPDDVDVNELRMFTNLYDAFLFLVGNYFTYVLAGQIQATQENRMMDAEAAAAEGHDQI